MVKEKMGRKILEIYGMEDEKGGLLGIVIASSFPPKITKEVLRIALEQMETSPYPRGSSEVEEEVETHIKKERNGILN